MKQRRLLLVERVHDVALASRLRQLGFDVWNISLHPGLLEVAVSWEPEVAIFDLGDDQDVPSAVDKLRSALRGKALTLGLSTTAAGFDVCFADRSDHSRLETVLASWSAAVSRPRRAIDRLRPAN